MDFDLFCKVVDQAWGISSTINLSFFGEPTIHPEFLQCLEYLRRRPPGKNVVIFSNFLGVTREMMGAMIRTRPQRIHISINAATPVVYDKIRSGQSCVDLDGNSYTENRFEVLCDKVAYWFALPNHPSTRHEFTVASYSVQELKAFVQKWLPLLGPNDEILTKCILSYGGIMLDDPFLIPARCRMWESYDYLVVDWKGNVSPCFLDNGMRLTIGSILQNSLRNINTGDLRKKIKRQSIARKIKPCDTCLDASHDLKTRIYKRGDEWSINHTSSYS
jgi:radical SAM protein with 4Fe4S-binding SPASM domain